MKKYHADLEPSYDSDPKEDSGEQMENFPGKIIWIRLAACVLGGIVMAVFVVSMMVILVNKILER